jgi:hypothetical protein
MAPPRRHSLEVLASQTMNRPAITNFGRRRLLIGGAAMLGASGCGWILYPERRGRKSGRVDVPILIIDLLWLLPGVIPGVICLVVDFTTGCIYEGGRGASRSPADEEADRRYAMAEVELDGAIVATGEVAPDRKMRLEWVRGVDEADVRARGRLFVRTPHGDRAEARLGDLL